MSDAVTITDVIPASIKDAVGGLVSARSFGETVYISLPLFFPSGTPVSVRVDRAPIGFRVSDNGFAYRELESVGAERSFWGMADAVIAEDGVERGKRSIFVEVFPEQLERAICDIGAIAWKVVDRIYENLAEPDVSDLEGRIQTRLEKLFGSQKVEMEPSLVGVSSTSWPMTAAVKSHGRLTVFQAVGAHANSIYRTSAAFRDLALLDRAPTLIAVVKSKAELGAKQSFLTQAGGRIIQADQSDETILRLAA